MKNIMKNILGALICLVMLHLALGTHAQTATTTKLKSTIMPLRLAIGSNKTTNLIFPYAIISVDRGTKDVLVQKAKGVENILQLKAGVETLKETNLTVVTADGTLHSFLLNYAHEPSVLNFNVGLNEPSRPVGILNPGSDNEAKLRTIAEKVAGRQPKFKLADKNADVSFRLCGIYIDDDKMFFQLSISNASNIRYDVEQLRFFLRDKKLSRRTAAQEVEQVPVHTFGNMSQIEALSENRIVVVVPKFTAPDGRVLVIQLMEQRGGRHLQLRLKNGELVRASQLTGMLP